MKKDEIRIKLDQIADCVYNDIKHDKIKKAGGLFDGETGILLFLCYYYKFSKELRYANLIEVYLEKLLDQLSTKINLHTYCSGYSGILYLFEFLKKNRLLQFRVEMEDSEVILEKYLIEKMNADIRRNDYDFLHGSLGIALYFLKKGGIEYALENFIDALYSSAEKDFSTMIFRWKLVLDKDKNETGYNISLSHGNAAIITFLSRLIKNNIKGDKIIKMLEGSVNYTLSQQMDYIKIGSYFPSKSLDNLPSIPTQSTMAWCYGDLGVALSLWNAGKALNMESWKNKALEVFLYSSKRISPTIDAGICHGSAGLAMIFRHMYFETKNDIFLQVSEYWLFQTLMHAQFKDGIAGYKTYYIDKWIGDYSLLMGISGIGLMFISYLMDDFQKWDEMFLLS